MNLRLFPILTWRANSVFCVVEPVPAETASPLKAAQIGEWAYFSGVFSGLSKGY